MDAHRAAGGSEVQRVLHEVRQDALDHAHVARDEGQVAAALHGER